MIERIFMHLRVRHKAHKWLFRELLSLDTFEFNFEPLKGIKFIGIVEFLSPTKMKMEGIRAEVESDKEQPAEFTNDTIEFEKVE